MESSTCLNKIIKNIIKRLNDEKILVIDEIVSVENQIDVEYCCGDIKVLDELIKYDFFEMEI